jgi:hypothetical protein
MNVYVSDSIFKAVSIKQDDETTMVQGGAAYLHLEQTGDKLNLYVPKSKRRLQVCLSSHLPMTLLKHLGVQNPLSGAALGSILTATNLFVVDELLQHAGIIEVEGIERPEDESGYESSSSETEEIPAETVNILSRGTALDATEYFSPRTPSHSNVGDLSYSVTPDPFTPATSIFSGSPTPPERLDLYKQLLEAVTQQAESLVDLPRVGQVTTTPMSEFPGLDASLAVSSPIDREREFKIGAAGELFVSQIWNHNKCSRLY